MGSRLTKGAERSYIGKQECVQDIKTTEVPETLLQM